MLHLIWSIIVGFIVGWIAKKTMGAAMGLKHMSFIWTVLLGVGGSILGGLIARLFSRPQPGAPFHPAGFIMSIIGAFVLLFIVAKLHLLG